MNSIVFFPPDFSLTPVKAFQFLYPPCHRRDPLMNIHLRYFVAFARPGVRDIDADLGGPSAVDLLRLTRRFSNFKFV